MTAGRARSLIPTDRIARSFHDKAAQARRIADWEDQRKTLFIGRFPGDQYCESGAHVFQAVRRFPSSCAGDNIVPTGSGLVHKATWRAQFQA
jgi:hypothetical protein